MIFAFAWGKGPIDQYNVTFQLFTTIYFGLGLKAQNLEVLHF